MTPRILVVDDEPFNLEIIGEYLEGFGADCSYLDDPVQAWSQLADPAVPAFDLIVLDRMMPEPDGLELLRRIKREKRYQQTPVIMQTAAALPEQIREGLESGAHYYLTKPYEKATLLSIIRSALQEVAFRSDTRRRFDEFDAALNCLAEGMFHLRTPDEATALAALLAQACPNPGEAVLGISELLFNAIEHGNLGISYAEKRALKLADTWEAEIARRQSLPQYRDKQVEVRFRRLDGSCEFTISDEGPGFPWQDYLALDPARACDPNGRGIALARMMSFDSLTFPGCGNVVVAVARHSSPRAFSSSPWNPTPP